MPNLNTRFPCAEAERGKFAAMTADELVTAGMTNQTLSASRGRYAILTYQINSPILTADNTYSQNTFGVQLRGGTNSTVTTSLSTFLFTPTIRMLEMYNNGINDCYFITNQTTTVDTLTSQGLLLKSGAFYSLEKSVSSVSFIADTGSNDVRIHGHY